MGKFADRFRVRKPAQVLKEADRKQIHEAALDVMAAVGIRVHSKMARESLKTAGADVDEKTAIVKLDSSLTQSLIDEAPSETVLAGRNRSDGQAIRETLHGIELGDGG